MYGASGALCPSTTGVQGGTTLEIRTPTKSGQRECDVWGSARIRPRRHLATDLHSSRMILRGCVMEWGITMLPEKGLRLTEYVMMCHNAEVDICPT